jgi:hypothetical protein
MILFCEFYEKGKLDLVDWNSDENHKLIKSQMDEIYNWWKVERTRRIKERDEILTEWSEHNKFWTEESKDFEGNYEFKSMSIRYSDYLFELHSELERILDAEEEKYLMMLAEIRNYLWT